MAAPAKKCAPTQPPRDFFKPPIYCRTIVIKKPSASDSDEELQEQRRRFIVSNPAKLLTLIGRLVDNTTRALEAKINKYLMRESESGLVFMINLNMESEEAMVQTCGKNELVSPLRKKIPEAVIKALVEYKDKALVCSSQLAPEMRAIFDDMLLKEGDLYAVPVVSNKHHTYPCASQTLQPVLLVCFLGTKKGQDFLVKLTNELFRMILSLLLNLRHAEEEGRQKRENENLLNSVKKLYTAMPDFDNVVKEIILTGKQLTKAQKCQLFLIDDHDKDSMLTTYQDKYNKLKTLKIDRDKGIAGYVSHTGALVNVDLKDNIEIYAKEIDAISDGFGSTHNILSFPIIQDGGRGIAGVIHLLNKIDNGNFDFSDERIAQHLQAHCAISIANALMYKSIMDAEIRTKLSYDLLLNHVKVGPEEVGKRVNCPRLHIQMRLDEFQFETRLIASCEMGCFLLKMFKDLGFMEDFGIKCDTLARFVLFVEKNHRDMPYHNFSHAFTTCHFAFVCIKHLELVERKYVTKMEALAFFIACLCHDVDHSGWTNIGNHHDTMETCNMLLGLYLSHGSVLKRLSLAKTLAILHTEGCNILESLNHAQYALCLNMIRDMIMATDLSTHFQLFNRQALMVQQGYKRNSPEHRFLLLNLLMTCADFSDQIKDWHAVKKAAESIYEEICLSSQPPTAIKQQLLKRFSMAFFTVDMNEIDIPVTEVDFLKNVCLPAYQLLGMMFEEVSALPKAVKRNILCWESAKCYFRHGLHEGRSVMELLISDELETEVSQLILRIEHPELVERLAMQEDGDENLGDVDLLGMEDEDDEEEEFVVRKSYSERRASKKPRLSQISKGSRKSRQSAASDENKRKSATVEESKKESVVVVAAEEIKQIDEEKVEETTTPQEPPKEDQENSENPNEDNVKNE